MNFLNEMKPGLVVSTLMNVVLSQRERERDYFVVFFLT